MIVALASLLLGPATVTLTDLWLSVTSTTPSHAQMIVWSLRLPRVLLALFAGAALAVGGMVLQTLFRNPLAESGLVGVSAGASMGAVLALWLGLSGLMMTSLFAFVGAMGATTLAWWVARHHPNAPPWFNSQSSSLLLAGVAINALVMSLVSLLMSLSDDQTLRSIVFWSLGSLARAPLEPVLGLGVIVVMVLGLLHRQTRALNTLLLGERQAQHVGLDVKRCRLKLIVLVSFLVAPTVALTGMIGFVGLIVPNLLRPILGSDHRLLWPACAMVGALIVLISDAICRVLVQPAELPVGVITALIGAPFFILMLLRKKSVF